MASIVPPLAEPPPAPVVEEETPPKPRRSLLLRILKWAGLSLLIFVLVSTLWVILYRFVAPPITLTQLFDGNGATREWVPIERIDRNMVRAVIAAEDSKFCTHHGFDTDAIAAAMRSNAAGNRTIRGGSTISQQTAKNAFLWQGGGYFRKGLEAWFTLLMETTWSKRRMMEVYLNIAETGIGTYGVNAGARRAGRGAGQPARLGPAARCGDADRRDLRQQ